MKWIKKTSPFSLLQIYIIIIKINVIHKNSTRQEGFHVLSAVYYCLNFISAVCLRYIFIKVIFFCVCLVSINTLKYMYNEWEREKKRKFESILSGWIQIKFRLGKYPLKPLLNFFLRDLLSNKNDVH